jgi:DNA-binding NarL/FixJ family response regulator
MTRNDPVSLKVLLVEDDDGFRRTVAESLNTRFPSVVLEEAADGSEVLEKVKTFLPQLVFMDIKLPGQNGLELTRQIKTLHPEIHVVMLTSCDSPEYREAARERGAYCFISKVSAMTHQVHDVVEELWTGWKTSWMQSA